MNILVGPEDQQMYAKGLQPRWLRFLLDIRCHDADRLPELHKQKARWSSVLQVKFTRKRRKQLSLIHFDPISEQEFVDCVNGGGGCGGGLEYVGWDYLIKNKMGVMTLADYPYVAKVCMDFTLFFRCKVYQFNALESNFSFRIKCVNIMQASLWLNCLATKKFPPNQLQT